MKISQREKGMLIFLCIALIGVALFMLVIKPMTLEITELEAELDLEKAAWEKLSTPIITEFKLNESVAQSYWMLQGPALQSKLDSLLFDFNYGLGNRITNKMGEALELSDSSIIAAQPEYSLYEKIKEGHLDPYVDFMKFSITPIIETRYTLQGSGESIDGKEAVPLSYAIATSRITVERFSCADTNDFFEMLNFMEKSGYIVIESIKYDPVSRVGDISFLVLMTPGDLGAYNVMRSPHDPTKYIHSDSVVCKYTGLPINEGSEE